MKITKKDCQNKQKQLYQNITEENNQRLKEHQKNYCKKKNHHKKFQKKYKN